MEFGRENRKNFFKISLILLLVTIPDTLIGRENRNNFSKISLILLLVTIPDMLITVLVSFHCCQQQNSGDCSAGCQCGYEARWYQDRTSSVSASDFLLSLLHDIFISDVYCWCTAPVSLSAKSHNYAAFSFFSMRTDFLNVLSLFL